MYGKAAVWSSGNHWPHTGTHTVQKYVHKTLLVTVRDTVSGSLLFFGYFAVHGLRKFFL